MAYFANRRGVRFGEHFFDFGERIPEEVRDQYPEPFARSLERGWVVVKSDAPPDLAALSKAKLLKLAEKKGVEVEGTGSGGTVLKSDLLQALAGVD